MNPQELAIEFPSQEARRAPGEGSTNGWPKPQRFSARQKTEVVLRLWRGEPRDLLSRELGIPAARLTTWREAFLDAGQVALKKQPRDSRDRELGHLREKLGEATMARECCVRKSGGWRPAALDGPGGRDDEPGPRALHRPAVWPGAGLPRVGPRALHRVLAAARAREGCRPPRASGSLSR
jgi:hypothetical protein